MKTLTWQKPGQQNVAQELIKIIINYVAELRVNTNTVVKTYDLLLQWGIIYTRRGLGYFVTTDALEKIKQTRSLKFMTENLPELFSQMKLLDISIDTVVRKWEEFKDRENL